MEKDCRADEEGMTMKLISRVGAIAVTAVLLLVPPLTLGSHITPSAAAGLANTTRSLKLVQFSRALQAAEARVRPHSFAGPTQPVAAPRSEKLWVIECDATLAGCRIPAEGAAAAARKLGWSVNLVNGEGKSARFNQLINQAVAAGANAIITDGIDAHLASQGLANARSHGVVAVSVSEGSTPGPSSFNFDVSPNFFKLGKSEADYVIVQSKGSGDVLPLNDNEFVTAINGVQGFLREMKKCSSCKVEPTMQFISSDIATNLPGRLISYLQTHPKVRWIESPYDPAVTGAIVPALHRAGLNKKVQVTSTLGIAANLQLIKKGDVEVADASFPESWLGWAGIDQTIRILAHKTTSKPADENTPTALIVKGNLPKNLDYTGAPVNFQAAYLKVWGR
jgi:ribose transport system substrate-binding protein